MAFVPTQVFQSPPEVDRPHTAQEQIAHLERLCGQQALERERLAFGGRCSKKSLASTPIQQRHALIERVREQMPSCSVRKLCRMLQVNRQWYYQHRRPTVHQERDQRLRAAIQEVREVFAGYGYRRVTKALVRSGWKINHKRVWRVMRQAGLTRQAETAYSAYHRLAA